MKHCTNRSLMAAVATMLLTTSSLAGGIMLDYIPILDFDDTDQAEWMVVNDGVMGGRSQSDIRRTDSETGEFSGQLSLENNGGFASVRALLDGTDFSSAKGLEIRVRGDGREYQLRLRTNQGFDGVSYRAVFSTLDGVWATIRLPFYDFLPTFRGRILMGERPLDTSDIQQLGILLADKNPGNFNLEIDFIRAYIDTPRDS